MDFGYCQVNSTIISSFERETGKCNRWKELAGILEFDETGKNSERWVPALLEVVSGG
jgi:hypothetical protein